MSRINVDSLALTDPRFGRLAQLLGLADADHARSKVEWLWLDCTERGEFTLPRWLVEQRLGPRAFDVLVESELGKLDHRTPDRIYICGSKERTGWKSRLQQSASNGGKARAGKSSRVAGRFTSQVDGEHTSAPAPAPAPAPALIKEESGDSPGLAALKSKVDAATGDIGKQRNKRAAKVHPDRALVIDAFHQRFKQAHGTKPTWRNKEVGQIAQLLQKHPAGVLIERINFMFDGKAKWPPPPYSLDVFVKNIDRWVEQAASAPIRKEDEL